MLTRPGNAGLQTRWPGEHPSDKQIAMCVRGQVDETAMLLEFERHVQWCDDCRTKALQIGHDPLMELVRRVRRGADKTSRRLVEGYDLVEEAGRGANGIVYRAVQRGLDRMVALKFLAMGVDAPPGELARFRRESEALAKLDHPSIVRIHDVGELDGVPYLAMEWIGGQTLAEHLRCNRISPRTLALWMIALSEGIQHAHQQGILHRDLKPQNVLVAAGQVKIVDFGLAHFTTQDRFRTRTGSLLGTPAYAAPEQLRGETDRTGPASDVYGLGAILYEGLTGRPPFDHASALETVQQVLHREPIPIRDLRPSIPKDLAVICHRCLEKQPHRRFPSAQALADDLRRFVEGKAILSRTASPGERLLRWTRRHPWPVAFGVILVVAISVVFNMQRVHQQRLAVERDQSMGNYQRARSTVWEMLNALQQESGFDIPRLNVLRNTQAQIALGLFEQLAHDDGTPESILDLAEMKMRYGSMLLGGGNHDEGQQWLNAARDAFDMVLIQSPEHAEALSGLIDSQIKIAVGLSGVAKNREAREKLQSLLLPAEQLVRRHPRSALYKSKIAWIRHNLGNVLCELQEYSAAIREFDEAISIRAELCHDLEDPTECLRRMAESQVGAGLCQMLLDDKRATQTYLEAIATMQSILDRNPQDTETMHGIATAHLNRSNILASQGDEEGAIEACSQGIQLLLRARQGAPDVASYRDTLAMLYGNRALFRISSENEALGDLVVDDWQSAVEQTTNADIRSYCQTMLVRSLAKRNSVAQALSVASSLDVEQFNDQNLFCWIACLGMTCNVASELKSTTENRHSLISKCVTQMRWGIGELMRRNALDEATEQDIRGGDDFTVFRQHLSQEELDKLLTTDGADQWARHPSAALSTAPTASQNQGHTEEK